MGLVQRTLCGRFLRSYAQPVALATRPASSPCTGACAKPSQISRRRFIGRASTSTWSPLSRLITACMGGIFSESLAHAPESVSVNSWFGATPCRRATEVLGSGRLVPLDRNAKGSLMMVARALMRHQEKGKATANRVHFDRSRPLGGGYPVAFTNLAPAAHARGLFHRRGRPRHRLVTHARAAG